MRSASGEERQPETRRPHKAATRPCICPQSQMLLKEDTVLTGPHQEAEQLALWNGEP